jgi:hypothetical protein
MTFEFTEAGAELNGHLTAPEAKDVYEGSVNGEELARRVDISTPMPLKLKFEGQVEGDSMVGKTKAGLLPASGFTAERS